MSDELALTRERERFTQAEAGYIRSTERPVA